MNKIEEKCYEIAAREVANRQFQPSVMAKAFSESGGDEKKAIALYIKLRVEQLYEGIQAESRRQREEADRRSAEEQQRQRDAERKAQEEIEAEDRSRAETERARLIRLGMKHLPWAIPLLVVLGVVAFVWIQQGRTQRDNEARRQRAQMEEVQRQVAAEQKQAEAKARAEAERKQQEAAEQKAREAAEKKKAEAAAREAAMGPGKPRVVDLGSGVAMEFVWIPALTGWVGKYEVTNGEYRKFKADHDSGEFHGHGLNGDRQPVVMVNFEDAKAFADWLTKREKDAGRLPAGYRYRLPSEDEWKTFAQCGDGREYPWGNKWPPSNDWNYNGQEGAGSWPKIEGHNDGFPVTCPVEKSGRNDWGLYGVGGNVWEVIANGARRGASWIDFDQVCLRCSYRHDYDGSTRDYYCGFRLVLLH